MENETSIINKTVAFVKQTLVKAESGHDWWHIYRVWNMAKTIAATEECHLFTVELAALLHDIADSKFNNGNEEIGPYTAKKFLESIEVDSQIVEQVVQIIENISFRGGHSASSFRSVEFSIVQDADRLDAMGAIGIARTFNYGGFKNRPIYDPEIQPNHNLTKEEYKNSTAPTINHFYEKLLLLKDLMNTEKGKAMALKRHRFMKNYLAQFYKEWNGEF